MSGIATGTALLIGGGLAAAGSVASGVIGSNAATNAADTQTQAAEKNAAMQAGLGQEQLTAEEQQNQQNQANLQPWLQSGTNANATLQYLLGMGGENPAAGGTTQGAGQTVSIPGVSGGVNIPGVTTTTAFASYPSTSTAIASACIIVLSRCAITSVVRRSISSRSEF